MIPHKENPDDDWRSAGAVQSVKQRCENSEVRHFYAGNLCCFVAEATRYEKLDAGVSC